MIIKVSERPERYINTDNVEVIDFPTSVNHCLLSFRSGRQMKITENAGRLALTLLEANDALLDESDPTNALMGKSATPIPPGLMSRIAQFLRDECPNGSGIMDLTLVFSEVMKSDTELSEALDALVAERVIVFVEDQQRYFHATNVRRTAIAPDSSVQDF